MLLFLFFFLCFFYFCSPLLFYFTFFFKDFPSCLAGKDGFSMARELYAQIRDPNGGCPLTIPNDVSLVVGENRVCVPAHKFLLALNSKFFRQMFFGSGDFLERNSEEVLLELAGLEAAHEEDLATFWRMMAFCYTKCAEGITLVKIYIYKKKKMNMIR